MPHIETNPGTATRSDSGAPQAKAAIPSDSSHWLTAANQVSDILAADAGQRDRANAAPFREIALLKQSGLTKLLGPEDAGGAGQSWSIVCRVVRRVARGDASIAQLLGYHYTWFKTPILYGSASEAARFEKEATREGWFLAGALNPRDADVVATDVGDAALFNGRKSYASGVQVADVFFLEGVDPSLDTHILGLLPVQSEGVQLHGDWDNLGQRLTASSGLTLNDVRVPWDRCFGSVDKKFVPHVRNTLDVPLNQMIFSNLYLGSAEGALLKALAYTRESQRPWGGYKKATQEPRIQELYGHLQSKLWAAAALADEVAAETDSVLGDVNQVTAEARGELASRVFAVKSVATDTALEICNRIFEAMGTRSTASSYDFDLYWRNVRTHTLHDPVSYKRQDLGAYLLEGALPKPSGYS